MIKEIFVKDTINEETNKVLAQVLASAFVEVHKLPHIDLGIVGDIKRIIGPLEKYAKPYSQAIKKEGKSLEHCYAIHTEILIAINKEIGWQEYFDVRNGTPELLIGVGPEPNALDPLRVQARIEIPKKLCINWSILPYRISNAFLNMMLSLTNCDIDALILEEYIEHLQTSEIH